MKKLFLSLIIILLLSVVFTSCAIADPGATPSPEESSPALGSTPAPESTPTPESIPAPESTPIPESSPTLESTPIDDDTACTVVFSFKSIEDFELYCKTGSTDASLYKEPPTVFPHFKMQDGIFMELNDLFPDLDMNAITVRHIEIRSEGKYLYGCHVNDTKTRFMVHFWCQEDASDLSAEKIIEKNSEYYTKSIIGDYYTSKEKPDSRFGIRTLYAFELNDVVMSYSFYGEEMSGVSVYSGNYTIVISAGGADDRKVLLSDEALKPITDLFRDGEARIEALNKIKEYIESKK